MKSHAAERGADLLYLIALNRRYELEDALAARKARRLAHARASRLGWESRRASFNRIDAFKGEGM